MGNDQTWMNDNNHGLSETTEQQYLKVKQPFSYKYTQGGTHLLSKDLMMDPRVYE